VDKDGGMLRLRVGRLGKEWVRNKTACFTSHLIIYSLACLCTKGAQYGICTALEQVVSCELQGPSIMVLTITFMAAKHIFRIPPEIL
jgi:hypothetical protein